MVASEPGCMDFSRCLQRVDKADAHLVACLEAGSNARGWYSQVLIQF